MKLNSKLINQAGGLLCASLVRGWMGTLDYQAAYYDRSVDAVYPEYREPVLCLLWHEYLLIPLYLRGHCNTAMLLSQHQDAELLGQAARHMGFETIRGSSTRGGAAALRKLFRKGRAMNLAITPDGPKGPRRTVAPGAIYLASRLEIPLFVMAMGYDRPWRLNSWDRFAIPRPYSRARLIFGPKMRMPADLDRDGIEHHRQQVERLFNELTEEAEAWAASGSRYANQMPLHREGIPIHYRRAA
ncbi:MAG TPA: lysophospholipid acyltransferase family protein [Pirellulaceae bacterium]|nr:lysophospholipid acyltransferase family protein [Pirellulaceae bacterium]